MHFLEFLKIYLEKKLKLNFSDQEFFVYKKSQADNCIQPDSKKHTMEKKSKNIEFSSKYTLKHLIMKYLSLGGCACVL